ncbi:Alaserpin [Eumeta japonica]|uniref:Alaserpin n=1 Tax=Eumeta variegata TaxID=151549 RepID=A0A4C1VZJ7_EUMVA|nr:Alaserpin [Eumeta japonica]
MGLASVSKAELRPKLRTNSNGNIVYTVEVGGPAAAASPPRYNMTEISQLTQGRTCVERGCRHEEVVKSNPGKSVVLSAFSVLPPLAQLSLASVGESHDELLHAMGLQNNNVTRAMFPVVMQQLQSAKGVELKLASKVYVAQGYQIQEQFKADTRRLFYSEIKNINFIKSTDAASEINQWVEDKTNHRIKDLTKPDYFDEDTRAVLVNAIYFKGSWRTKFIKDATTDRDFHVSAANTIKIPTMFSYNKFKYSRSDELNAQLLEIPYEGDEASFLIVLPNDIEGLPALEQKLKENPALLTEASQQMYSRELEVFLPKFKIETTIDLKEVLQKIGVTKIFKLESARLENLIETQEPLYVSTAIQKAFIEVNEEGAEATAANASCTNLNFGKFIKSVIKKLDQNEERKRARPHIPEDDADVWVSSYDETFKDEQCSLETLPMGCSEYGLCHRITSDDAAGFHFTYGRTLQRWH